MKKVKKIVLTVCLVVLAGAVTCGVLYAVRINRIMNEEKEIALHLKNAFAAIKGNDLQGAEVSLNEAEVLIEQSIYEEELEEVKDLLDEAKEVLEELKYGTLLD